MKSLSYVCSGLFCKPTFCFCFGLWYSSCFKVKCWFHTFPKRCYHIPMWILILLDHRDRHVNSFQPACFSSSGSEHFNIRKIKYQFFSTLFVSSVSKLSLFSHPPTFFIQGLRFLNKLSILFLWSLSILSFNVLIRRFSWRCSTSPLFFVLFLLRWF